MAGAAPAGPIEVPAGVQIDTRLRDAIAHATVARGDRIYAVVTSDVKRAGRVVIPKGAVIVGRVTRIVAYMARSSVFFGVALQFESIEFGGRRGGFTGSVEAVGVGTNYFSHYDPKTGESVVTLKNTMEKFEPGTRLLIRKE